MENVVKVIEALDLSSTADGEIREHLAKFKELGSIVFKLPKGRFIHRSIPMNSEEERQTDKSCISFNPDPSDYGRANIPHSQIFYGSITTDREAPTEDMSSEETFHNSLPGYIVNITECSDLIVKEELEGKEGKEYFTIGMWEIKRDLELAVIHDIESRNYLSRGMKKDCDEFYSQLDEAQRKSYTALQNLLSQEFSKEVKEGEEYAYKISANFSHHLIELGYTGLIYPSVKTGGEGFNVALNPELFRNGSIELKRAVFMRMYSNTDKQIVWDWVENAEYIEGQPLDFTPIPNVSMSDEVLRLLLHEKGIEHLFD